MYYAYKSAVCTKITLSLHAKSVLTTVTVILGIHPQTGGNIKLA